MDDIKIIGAAENNLKHVNLNIPKGKLVVLAGVSGSGKSSLAFDTIAVESNRQWQASYPLYLRNKMPHYERPKVDSIENLTPVIVVDQKPLGSGSRSTVGTAVDVAPLVRLLFSRVGQPSAGGSMAYSFNHPNGTCPSCTGLGRISELEEGSLFDLDKSLKEGAILFSQFAAGWQRHLYLGNPLLDSNKRLRDYSAEEWEILCLGTKEPLKIEIRSNQTGRVDRVDYEGIIPRFRRLYLNRDISKLKKSLQEEILSHVRTGPCAACEGTGLNPKALASKIGSRNIIDYLGLPVRDLLSVLDKIEDPRGVSLVRQIASCLHRMTDVGIGYLSLGRPTDTLSGGEAQRIKLVRNLGSSLSGITYVFDEPTAGLHPADAEKIGRMLFELRDRGNTVLAVEHNRQIIALADHVIELGPHAGEHGGKIVYDGDATSLLYKNTPTAKNMNEGVRINQKPLPWSEGILISHASRHNLKDISVTIPKGVLTAITGVAGSGKSTLACRELVERCPEAIVIDQKPVSTSIRSTPATYTGAMEEIRTLFAKENGVGAEWFSFNSKGGCPACRGKGEISYEMAFAEPVVVPCEECGGRRYNPTSLRYTYRGKNIKEVMDLTVEQAMEFFPTEKVRRRLRGMMNVGLGYLTLGQATNTLSGGEVQRVKLASELHKEGNLYILDEPSTGLHGRDVEDLLSLLRRLVNRGNTVVIVEHRLELIAQTDWVIDMGPEGGSEGGEILFCGTPGELAGCPTSKTGRFMMSLM
ncbi:daunorubicin resistance protein DrrC [Gordonibacter sp. An230]|uniref:ATP-binding cassette domain-containing protein n=1 Tax=Gordonibacter sp. An230 TaxID=1965592 RepID=UPI000B36C668|nr:excinuclease ABC subunit UvrA [Gordonibacter sp. An230]OUO89920.1 daunorubicin resistance protein DrrC [Gordonibacter sp. An230]